MKTTFKKSEANFGCYKKDGNKQDNFIKTEDFTITDVLCADVSLKDKTWFICNNCQFVMDDYQKFAIGCARTVLPIYEKKYSDNKAIREAIQAAEDYLYGIIDIKELRVKRIPAYAAYYAAAYDDDDAYAARAAYVAYSAAYFAYGDGDTAYADAARAAAYAAYADENYKQKLLDFFIQFTAEGKTV